MSRKWIERAKAALTANPPKREFAASSLDWMIWRRECPDECKGEGNYSRFRAWQEANPGTSDGNMKRVCEALVAEGFLYMRSDRSKGWYMRDFFSMTPYEEAPTTPKLLEVAE